MISITPKTLTLRLLTLLFGLLALPLWAQEEATPAANDTESLSTLQSVQDRGTLRIGVNPEFKPFSFLDEAGERVGVDLQIGAQLADALGVELEVVATADFTDLIPALLDERIDLVIAGMSITFERATQVNFTDPYFDTGVSILMNVGRSTRLGVGNVQDSGQLIEALERLALGDRLTIAVTQGRAPEAVARALFPEATITGYPSNEDAAEATFAGQTHLMLHDEIFLKVWLKENEARTRFRMTVLDPPVKPDFYGIATRKGDLEWLTLMNVFVHELRANGQVIAYLSDYLPSMNAEKMTQESTLSFDVDDME